MCTCVRCRPCVHDGACGIEQRRIARFIIRFVIRVATVTIKTVQLRHRRATTPILCSYHIRFTCVVQLPPHSHHPNGPLFVPLQQAPAGDELRLLPPPPPPVGSGLEGQRNPLSLNKIPGSAFIAEVLQKVPSSPLCSMHPEDWGFCLTEPR